jgi:hypothetical protein
MNNHRSHLQSPSISQGQSFGRHADTNAVGADFGFNGPDPFVAVFETLAPLRTVRISVGKTF